MPVTLRVRSGRAVSAVVLALVAVTVAAGAAPAATTPSSSTSNNAGIAVLQRQLNALSCDAGPIDGKLGPDTESGIRWFQSAAGITVDGIVGPVTSAKLATASAAGTPNCKGVPKPPAPPKPTTGPPCTEALIAAAAQANLLKNEKLVLSGPYQCAGIWTYNSPTVQVGSGRADEGHRSHALERRHVASRRPRALLRERQRPCAHLQADLPLRLVGGRQQERE